MKVRRLDVIIYNEFYGDVLELLDPALGGHGGHGEKRVWIDSTSGRVLPHGAASSVSVLSEPDCPIEGIRQWIRDYI